MISWVFALRPLVGKSLGIKGWAGTLKEGDRFFSDTS